MLWQVGGSAEQVSHTQETGLGGTIAGGVYRTPGSAPGASVGGESLAMTLMRPSSSIYAFYTCAMWSTPCWGPALWLIAEPGLCVGQLFVDLPSIPGGRLRTRYLNKAGLIEPRAAGQSVLMADHGFPGRCWAVDGRDFSSLAPPSASRSRRRLRRTITPKASVSIEPTLYLSV
jgi:hypothetical protein